MRGASVVPKVIKYPYLLALASLAPLVWPTLPMNTAVFDYVNALFVFALWICLLFRHQVRVRLLAPMGLILFASLLSMLNSHAVVTNWVTILQEVYLFVTFLTIYNAIESEDDMRVLVAAWIACAALQSALTLLELRGNASLRAQGTFENPNMAASYLGVSAFLIWQSQTRLRWYHNGLFLLLIFGGIFATKSLSALLGSVLGLGSIAGFQWMRSQASRQGRVGFVALALVVTAVALAPGIRTIHNYFDRLPKSVDERAVIWSAGFKSFRDNPMGTGIGPAGFNEVGFVSGGYWGVGRRISLHSDYLSFLVERGVLGFAGLAAFLLSVGAMLLEGIRATRSERNLLWWLGLGAMFVFILIDAASHEVLHYRHVWLAFGLIAAQSRIAQDGRRDRVPTSGARPVQGTVSGR